MLSKLTSEQLEQCKAIILASFESDHVDSVRHKVDSVDFNPPLLVVVV